MGDPDMTDDWMNPPKRDRSWGYSQPKYPRFLIERKRRLDYFPFEEWGRWSSYDNHEERDKELAELREKHPVWILRARDELQPPMAFSNAASMTQGEEKGR